MNIVQARNPFGRDVKDLAKAAFFGRCSHPNSGQSNPTWVFRTLLILTRGSFRYLIVLPTKPCKRVKSGSRFSPVLGAGGTLKDSPSADHLYVTRKFPDQ